MSYLKFTGSSGSNETRPDGKKVLLEDHAENLEAALGLSMRIGENVLLQEIGESPLNRNQTRIECLFDNNLEVNKEQCKWCRSNRICSIAEVTEFTGRIEIEMVDIPEKDQILLKKFLADRMFDYGSDSEAEQEFFTENQASFLFNSKSPFVFSESNDFKKKMICKSLNSSVMFQPISKESSAITPRFMFSPKLGYSPPLQRNLTIFELQILNSLSIYRMRENPRGLLEIEDGGASCVDFFREVMEMGPSGFRLKRRIKRDIMGEQNQIGPS